MNKEDIKKALECCTSKKDGMCKHCPNYDYKHEDCMDDVKRHALDLITEQEKEIDLLKMQLQDAVNHGNTFLEEANKFEAENKRLKKEIEQLKSEIIKQDQAIIERNFELVELEDKLKQAKIDVLTELKEKKSIAVWDIDEMIERLQK